MEKNRIFTQQNQPPLPADRNRPWSLRRRIVGKILAFFFGRPAERPVLRPEQLRRVLLIRHDRLGDYVITTPVVETLKRFAPDVEIDVLASNLNADFVESDRRISNVIVWDRSRWNALRTARERDYDLTLQLVTRNTTVPIILAGLCTPRGRVVGRGHSYNRRLFDHCLLSYSSRHLAVQTYEILLRGIDTDLDPEDLPNYSLLIPERIRNRVGAELDSRTLAGKAFILVNATASEEFRQLSPHRLSSLLSTLRGLAEKKGLRVAVTGSPSYDQMIRDSSERSNTDHISFDSIVEACVAVERAAVVVTPDTSFVHCASALGTPVVAYYTEEMKPLMWGPRGVPSRIVVSEYAQDSESVSVDEIVGGVEELLE